MLAAAPVPPACALSTACTDGKITTASLPDATVGRDYAFQLQQSCGGRDAVSWQFADDPDHPSPPGIELSFDGRLFGTPTTAGHFWIPVAVHLSTRTYGSGVYSAGADSRLLTLEVRPTAGP